MKLLELFMKTGQVSAIDIVTLKLSYAFVDGGDVEPSCVEGLRGRKSITLAFLGEMNSKITKYWSSTLRFWLVEGKTTIFINLTMCGTLRTQTSGIPKTEVSLDAVIYATMPWLWDHGFHQPVHLNEKGNRSWSVAAFFCIVKLYLGEKW